MTSIARDHQFFEMPRARRVVSMLVVALLAVIAIVPRAGAADLRSFKGRNYDVRTDLAPDMTGTIVDHMDLVFEDYTRRFGRFQVRNARAMELYLFDRQEDYLAFFAENGVNAANTGGIFVPGVGLASFIGGRPVDTVLETLRHEGLHQFAFLRISDALPPWVNEGMAEYFGYSIATDRKLVSGLVPEAALSRLKDAKRRNRLLPLDRLIAMDQRTWNTAVNEGQRHAGLQYDQSWLLVHFLARGQNGRYANLLLEYIEDLHKGVAPDRAANRFGEDLGPMMRAFEKYIDELEPDAVSVASDRLRLGALAVALLHERGTVPEDWDKLPAALAEIGARVPAFGPSGAPTPGRGGSDTSTEALTRAWTEALALPEAKRGRAPVARLTPDRDGTLPPTIDIAGYDQRIRVIWRAGEDGRPAFELAYR